MSDERGIANPSPLPATEPVIAIPRTADPTPVVFNQFAVGWSLSGHINVLGLVVLSQRMAAGGLDEDEAVNLAAWLVALCPRGREKFDRLYRRVIGT